MDRLDQLVTEAIRQGWHVWQDRSGTWVFQSGGMVISQPVNTGLDLVRLVRALQGAGLVFPPDEG